MKLQTVTVILIAALVVLLSGYDVYAYFYGDSATISETIWRASRFPLIPFLAGILCGHLFWNAKSGSS